MATTLYSRPEGRPEVAAVGRRRVPNRHMYVFVSERWKSRAKSTVPEFQSRFLADHPETGEQRTSGVRCYFLPLARPVSSGLRLRPAYFERSCHATLGYWSSQVKYT